MTRFALFWIQVYRMGISPLFPPSCRFYPTCSEYAFQAVQKYGFWLGAKMAVRRLARCHPWGGGGLDPVR